MTTRKLTLATLAALALTAAPAQAAQRLEITGQVRLLPGGGSTMRQTGSFSGTPFGSGTINVTTNVGRGRGAVMSFRMFNRRGQIWGSGDAKLTFRGSKVSYSGTARITGGSGGVQPHPLERLADQRRRRDVGLALPAAADRQRLSASLTASHAGAA